MTERPIYRSLVNRVAVELPLLAKALVDDALQRHRLDPATVTPFKLKRIIDMEIMPRLAEILETSSSVHVSTLGGGFIQVARGDVIVHANPSARKMLEVPAGLTPGDLFAYLHGCDVLQRPEDFEAAGKTIHAWTVMYGSTAIQCHATAVIDPDAPNAEPHCVSVTLLDVTLERELEAAMSAVHEELRRKNRRLSETTSALMAMADRARAASKAKDQFLATMTHEIRTPLNAVIGLTELLLDTELTPEQREYAETSVNSARILLSLLHDLLDLSKLQAGRLEIERTAFELRTTIHEALGIVAPKALAKRIEFGSDIAPDVPRRALGDPVRLRQVLLNLLDNAVKFTQKGSVHLGVRVGSSEADAVVVLFDVTDTGIGIPEDRIGDLFEPFTQADASTTRRFGGTGLGLSICRQLIDRMGGEIAAHPAAGGGATFWFTVPYGLPEASPDDDAPPVGEAVPAGSLHGRILIAEDNAVNRLVIIRMLERLGLEVDAVPDGAQAVEALKRPYDILLTDLQMPVMDGYDAVRAIRAPSSTAHDPSIPVIAVTATATERERARCLAAGMDDFLSKPLEPAILARTVERWLARVREQRDTRE